MQIILDLYIYLVGNMNCTLWVKEFFIPSHPLKSNLLIETICNSTKIDRFCEIIGLVDFWYTSGENLL